MLASLFMKRHERRCYALSFKFWGEHTPLAAIGQGEDICQHKY